MLFIHGVLNLLLWAVYVVFGMTCLSFIVPSFGGSWSELNTIGKFTCIGSGFIALVAMFILVTTYTLPF